MKKFLSCDWGVTSFRLRVVETQPFAIIAEERSDQGIARSFALWQQNRKTENDRSTFYLEIVHRHIDSIQKKTNSSLNKLPLVISGMASSSIGIIELPYKEMPFSADGADLELRVLGATNVFREVTIISGAKTDNEVMRGEETQLVGCFDAETNGEVSIFVFPGTHSKHVLVKGGKATDLKTYMSGEFFKLLCEKSILSASIKASEDFGAEEHRKSFEEGVRAAAITNLLQSCFQVRTNNLLGKKTREENYFYLSGLVIGTEMNELTRNDHARITLVCNKKLSPFYDAAFNVVNENKSILKIQDADEAVVKGQYKIYEKMLNNK